MWLAVPIESSLFRYKLDLVLKIYPYEFISFVISSKCLGFKPGFENTDMIGIFLENYVISSTRSSAILQLRGANLSTRALFIIWRATFFMFLDYFSTWDELSLKIESFDHDWLLIWWTLINSHSSSKGFSSLSIYITFDAVVWSIPSKVSLSFKSSTNLVLKVVDSRQVFNKLKAVSFSILLPNYFSFSIEAIKFLIFKPKDLLSYAACI